MTAKPVPNAYEPRTSLAWTVEGLIGSMPYSLSGEMGGGWRLSGTLTANCEIGQFIDTARRHVAGDHSGTEWFGGGTFPAFRLGMVEVAYDAARPAFSMAADLTVELAKGRPGGSLGLRFAFCRVQVAGERRTLAALTTTSPLRLSEVVSGDTGLIGQIAGGLQIERVAICYADAAFSIEDDLLGTGAKGKASFAQGLSFTAELGDGKAATPVTVIPPPEPPRPAGGDRQTTGGGKPAQAPPQGGQPCWKEVGKTYGPLHLRRIGGEWRDGKLGLLLDAAVELAGLRLDLMGLSVRLPPAKLTSLSFSDLDFSLDGLALALKRGPVAIGGGLLKTVENGQVSFVGTATIRTAAFSLSAIGSYATAPGGQASFFIYGAYGGTLGGPPAFIVQGIAAGFGYNRSLTVPPLDEVASFPLVSQVMNPDSDSGAALAKSGHFPVAVGDYWLAAGIRFSSFKLVDGFALATVQFGTRTEITLLGLAVLSQPVGTENPFVRVELALKARFSPDEGALGIVAALTPNSYLFSKDCKLTGGLAFNVWFEPTAKGAENHAGDFVITLGGYHPKLQVRPHYPTVARVGLKWLMPDKGVSVEGGVYFAVTPSFVMAGGHLSAIYQSEAVRAWFSADADFLVGWEPFSYAAEIKVRLGASATVKLLWVQETLDFELGVLFRVWGPPFSGEVKADLGVLTVTIPIGETERLDRPKPLSWATFAAKFFPRPAPGSQELRPLSVVVAAGISGERREGKVARPLVNGGELRLMVSCFVPLTEVPKGGKVTGGKPFDTKLGIRPMNARLQSSTVALQCRGPAGPVEQLEVEGTVSNLPEALWSTKPPPDPDKDELKVGVVAALSGANVKLKPRLDPLPTVEANLDETRVINTSVRSGGRQCYEHAAYVSPEKARDRFNNCVGLPRREVLEGLAAEGFSFAGGDLRLRHDQLQIRNSGHSMLYAVPELVPLGKLRAQVAG